MARTAEAWAMTRTEPDPTRPSRPRSDAVAQAQTAQQLANLVKRLPPPPARVLDAGCGMGDLALALAGGGYDVTAIDNDPGAVTTARARGVPASEADIATYEARPFEAVLFSLSLHHVDDLRDTVARARTLLCPGGVLVIDEFAWERADPETAAWFYDTVALLGNVNLLRSTDYDAAISDPLGHWVRRHREDGGLHSGEAMINAVAGAFDLREAVRVPYLHRYLGGRLAEGAAALPAYTTLREIEERRIAEGHLRQVGLRLLAHHQD